MKNDEVIAELLSLLAVAVPMLESYADCCDEVGKPCHPGEDVDAVLDELGAWRVRWAASSQR